MEHVLRSPAFNLSKIDQLDAIGKGFSCVEMNWQAIDGQWLPIGFDYRDPRFFAFRSSDPEQIALRSGSALEELVPHKWLVHRAKAKSGLTIRGGLARQVAWIWMLQSFNSKDWAIFAEAFGMPYRLGRYDAGASENDNRALLQALIGMGTDGAGIIPKESLVELLEASVAGSTDLFERRAVYLDRQVSKIVLGQTSTTDEGGGGYALGKVHNDVREDIRNADAEQWAATLNEQLVPPLIGFNFARNRSRLPRIEIVRNKAEDTRAWVENVAALLPLGLEVSVAEVQRRLNIRPPKDGEEILRVL